MNPQSLKPITATILSCPFGYLLVAATPQGLCHLSLSPDPPQLPDHVSENPLIHWTRPLVQYLNGTHPWPRLPYEIQGTPFQQLVWNWLYTIPAGKTYSYSHVAQAIGHPRAARAVGRACATNPVAIIIPCHRILPKSGGIGGYRWEPLYKQRLLQLEHFTPR